MSDTTNTAGSADSPMRTSETSGELPTMAEPALSLAPGTDLEPRSGDLIAGKFRVVSRLGSGSMGIVLLAHDEELGREVALKVVRRHRSDEDFVRERFLAEAKAMARVRHRNVVQIYAHTRWEERSVLVMEYMPCQSLLSWLEERKDEVLALGAVAEILDSLCAGLAAIHAAGAVHRDLKPENVLMAHDGRIAIADLGLARTVEDPEAPWFGGTPAYMSPEQLVALGQTPEPRRGDDLWALNVLAYKLLTGQRPFPGAAREQIQAGQHQPLPQVRASRAELAHSVDLFFARAFDRDPAARPQSADELRAAFSGLFARPDAAPHLRVVLAEDDPDFLLWLTSVIGDLLPGAEVLGFERASDAFVAATTQRASLVITDLDMPNIDGLGFTQRLRADARTRSVPILVLTGSGGADDWQALRSSGADAFLVKPVHIGVLAATMERLMRDSLERAAPHSHPCR